MSKSVVEKLGVKSGLKVWVVGGGDYLLPRLSEVVGEEGKLLHYEEWRDFDRDASSLGEVDVFLFWVGKKPVLELFFREVRPFLKSTGAIWVGLVKKKFRKGDGGDSLGEFDVLRAGRDAGYVDVKVVSLSDSEYALKFVIPVSER